MPIGARRSAVTSMLHTMAESFQHALNECTPLLEDLDVNATILFCHSWSGWSLAVAPPLPRILVPV